jgi:two-component system KDP operon response regulator KdpE
MTDDGAKPRVLVVDGHPDIVEVLMRQLRRHGYVNVTSAATPGDALALLAPTAPDAVLVDLGLPLLDGHSLLHHLRRSPRWSSLPVLLLTGRQPASAIKAAAQEGATGFIQRPFNGLEIIYKIEQAVRGGEARAAELSDLARDETPAAE